ncbi:MAG: thrombospondin type 3 repeat-containing protein, partial [Actinomycetota bacterium]|nr:thrombospondin type 3 repeat-containing protein [Actinomycetota bacterium]
MRTSTSVLATFISLGLAGFATSTASAQNTLTVCPNGCDFTSIAQAYSAASDDDVIEIGPGVYPTSLTINGSDKPLTFVGTISSEGGPATVLQPVSDGEGILRFWGVSGLTFRDLEFSGCSGRPAASFFNESTLRFEHCIFRDNEGTGTGGEFGGAVHSNRSFPTFVSCQFLGNSDPRGGAVFAKNGGHARFYDCILIGNTATVSGFTGSQHNVGAIWWNDDLHGSPFQGVLMTIDGCVICDNIQSGPQITVDGYQGSDNCILTSCGLDSDGDLAPDSCDLFPADPTEFNDSDGDGVGNNADICPGHDDSLDADFDGVPDGCDACPGYDDSFDADSDGTPDGCDGCPDDDTKSDPGQCGCFVPDTDSDGDGTADCIDGCPDDGNKTEAGVCGCGVPDTDSDSDGIPDCIDNCPDTSNQDQANTDGDSHGDACDAFPDDPTETLDSDGDGVGDNADDFPNDDSETTDSDGDGVGDNADEFPNDDSETTDTDGDGVGDNADVCPGYNDITSLDSDEDGVPDVCDALPYDPTETMDSDGDGVGDNADDLPYDPTETVDSDGDGAGNGIDLWPDDPSEWSDYDGDGIGDNADEDQISVCANGCDFTSIAQAYSAASDDDVIVVGPGAYSTSLTINGSDKPLTFVGTISSEGGPATVLQPVSD